MRHDAHINHHILNANKIQPWLNSCKSSVDLYCPNIVLFPMRDIFTPIFLSVLAALFFVDGAAVNPFIFMPLALTVFVLFLILF